MPLYTFPVVSPAAFIICTAFIFGDVLPPAVCFSTVDVLPSAVCFSTVDVLLPSRCCYRRGASTVEVLLPSRCLYRRGQHRLRGRRFLGLQRTPICPTGCDTTSRLLFLLHARCPSQHAYSVAWCHVITSDYQDGTQAPQS